MLASLIREHLDDGKVRILIGGGEVPHDGLRAGVALGFAIADILEHVVSLV